MEAAVALNGIARLRKLQDPAVLENDRKERRSHATSKLSDPGQVT